MVNAPTAKRACFVGCALTCLSAQPPGHAAELSGPQAWTCLTADHRSITLRQRLPEGFASTVHCEPAVLPAPARAGAAGSSPEPLRSTTSARAGWNPPIDLFSPAAGLVLRLPRSAGDGPPRPAPASRTPAHPWTAYATLLRQTAQRHALDERFLAAVMEVESGFKPQAVSKAGALGLMQVMPATARRFGMADPHRDLLDPALNVEVAARYLGHLRGLFQDDWYLVTAAYNAGEGSVRRHGNRIPPFPETQDYVRKVEKRFIEHQARSRATLGAHVPSDPPADRLATGS